MPSFPCYALPRNWATIHDLGKSDAAVSLWRTQLPRVSYAKLKGMDIRNIAVPHSKHV